MAEQEAQATIRVLVVDDSPTMRLLLTEIINRQPDMRVIGTAADPLIAREMIKELNPDVLTLDIEMPGMDGISFLDRIMRLRPMPVIMVSSAGEKYSEIVMQALEIGAVDFVHKRPVSNKNGLSDMAQEVVEKVRGAYAVRHRFTRPAATSRAAAKPQHGQTFPLGHVIFVGASTGGTEAIREFLEVMPENSPPILIAQHMPEGFTARFAQRLDRCCQITVKEAVNGERVRPGVAYIAPGHSHLVIKRIAGGELQCQLLQTPEVNRHRPSVDVLFFSAAEQMGKHATGIMLTGMGKDGAQGMLAMRDAGAVNFAQNEDSCIVYGMPKAAFDIGAVHEVGVPQELTLKVIRHLSGGRA